MKTRQEILIEANKESWNRALDAFVSTECDETYLKKGKELLEESRKNSKNDYEEDIEIFDSFTITKFVMTEKYLKNNYNWSLKFWKNTKENQYKIIKKIRSDGSANFIKMSNKSDFINDVQKLQKELELKKYNIFYDGDDIDQVIKYYSNLPDVEF